jgi:hypothetical protein
MPLKVLDLNKETQQTIQKEKKKTLQLLSINPPPSMSNQQNQLSQPTDNQCLEITKKLTAMKQQKSPEHQKQTMTAAVKGTGMTMTNLTEAQWLCLKRFKAHHKAWNARNKWDLDLITARYYRLNNTEMALYLFIIHPQLYK